MKNMLMLATASLLFFTSLSIASETEFSQETIAYCQEQAQLSGLESEQEIKDYIRDCQESMGMATGEYTGTEQ